VPAGDTIELRRGGRVLDQFPSGGSDSYLVRELWPGTSNTFSVRVLSAAGTTVGNFAGGVVTPPATAPFPRLYASNAFVNMPVDRSPSLDSNSAATVSRSLVDYADSATLSNNDAWGIPIVSADVQSSRYDVGCREYWCDLNFGTVHIPASARPNTGSDGHLVVLEPDGSEMDMWIGQHSGSSWTAASRWLDSANGPAANCTTAHACGGADSASLALAAGVVRPEEIAQGHIDHALLITTPYTRQGYVACPATNGDGHNATPDALPLGAHVQLDPQIDVSSLRLPAWQKVIAVALQKYGAYVGDTGGSLEVRAESNIGRSYDAWAKAGVPADAPSLSDLPWSSMRVLSMRHCAS
jgi:hypothetical protein